MQTVTLNSAAWYGDRRLTLDFPPAWKICEVGLPPLPTLGTAMVRKAIAQPIAAPPISRLAKGKESAVIIIDDITRPTPSAELLPLIVEELTAAGLPLARIAVVIAGGTHAPASQSQIEKKVGGELARQLRVEPHRSDGRMDFLGRSTRGTPLWVNPLVIQSEVKIGVGCIYPHPTAGFSGGSKIVMPGVCGTETVRSLHQYRQGAERRGGSLQSEFRSEVDEVARKVGIDLIVNVVLNSERQIVHLVAGDPVEAHRRGVEVARSVCSVKPVMNPEVVIADMYPFHTSLQFAHDRGLWPMLDAPLGASRIAIAALRSAREATPWARFPARPARGSCSASAI